MLFFIFYVLSIMITEKEWILLLKKYWLNQIIINHCIWVSKIGYKIAKNINKKENKDIVDAWKIKLTCLLHDIWKSREWLHELNSVDILKEEWLDDLSKIVLHWFVYEYYKFKGIDNSDYLPKNLEQKIVVLSDMYYNQNQQIVTIEERFSDIFKRYNNDINFIKIAKLAKKRMLKLENEINNLL